MLSRNLSLELPATEGGVSLMAGLVVIFASSFGLRHLTVSGDSNVVPRRVPSSERQPIGCAFACLLDKVNADGNVI